MRYCRESSIWMICLLLVVASPAWAGWPAGDVIVCDAPGFQDAVEVRSDGLGGAVLTWKDWRRGLSYPDFFAQRMDADAAPLWGANGKNFGQWSIGPWVMDSDGAGGIGYGWDGSSGIMGWHIDSTGSSDWDTFGFGFPSPIEVSGASGTAPRNPVITSDGQGGFYFLWGDAPSGFAYFHAQHVDANGFDQWATGGVDATVSGARYVFPAYSASGTGNLKFVFLDQSTGTVARLQMLSSTGARMLGDQGLLLSDPLVQAATPTIVEAGAAGFYVAWREWHPSSVDDRVRVMRFDANGVPLWASPVDITPSDAWGEFCVMPDGGLLMAWSEQGGSTADLHATWLAPDGSYVWPNGALGVPVCTNSAAQSRASAIVDANGEVWVTWTDNRSGSYYGYYQHMAQDGSLLGTPDGDPLSSGVMVWPADLVRTPSGVVAFYRDYRNGSPDIFARLLGGGPTTGIPSTPGGLVLQAGHPSPFTSRTTIQYSLSRAQHVELSVFDLRGRRVRVLESTTSEPGRHEARWDGRDDEGRSLASGVYVVQLRAGDTTRSGRVVLVR